MHTIAKGSARISRTTGGQALLADPLAPLRPERSLDGSARISVYLTGSFGGVVTILA